jgi:asparagine synthase (glutamine-hydrolysing)
MCGFAGFWSTERSRQDIEICCAMTDVIAHRGPDDQGAWQDDRHPLTLGHRRLSILDLSPEGHQPMASASGRYQIAYNGEIYNHGELRSELLAHGIVFRGHSDTEVLLAAVERWGLESALERMVGMFAFAIWDREKAELALVRDRFGEKPLYYTQVGDALLFGSELKALQRHPRWRGTIDRNALALYFRHNYMPAPYTIFEGVRKVVPGSIVRFTGAPTSEPALSTYWSSRAAAERGMANPLDGTDEEILDELDACLRRTIGDQMVADVPVGAFLSGGIDSSLVVALMQAGSSRPVRTFSIGFHERQFDEAQHARAVARHLGTDHVDAYVSPEEARGVIPQLPTLYDEPFADSSQIPTYLVAALARKHVTVSLSGDGGDELFGGYGRYAELMAMWDRLERWPKGLRTLVGRRIEGALRTSGARTLGGLRGVLPSRARRAISADRAFRMSRALAATEPESVYRELLSYWSEPSQLVPGAVEPVSLFSDFEGSARITDVGARMMYLDSVTYLPDDILVKVDRATMGVSLESRAPLLDHRVAELAWRIPQRTKIRGGEQKWVLKQLLYRYVPRELVDRPKMGFGVPVGDWLRGPLKEWAADLLSPERIRRDGLIDPAVVTRIWHEHLAGSGREAQLWGILMLQAWLDTRTGSSRHATAA